MFEDLRQVPGLPRQQSHLRSLRAYELIEVSGLLESFADADEQMVNDGLERETRGLELALVLGEGPVDFEERRLDGVPDCLLAAVGGLLCFVVSRQVVAEQPAGVAQQEVLLGEARVEEFLG